MTAKNVAQWGQFADIVHWIEEHPRDVEWRSHDGRTFLHWAVMRNIVNADQVKDLISRGISPSAQTINGETPLHLAAIYSKGAVARSLIEYGAPVNAQADILAQSPNGEVLMLIRATPLHAAAYVDNRSVARVLLANDVNPNLFMHEEKTALDIAEEQGHHDIASVIEGGDSVGYRCGAD